MPTFVCICAYAFVRVRYSDVKSAATAKNLTGAATGICMNGGQGGAGGRVLSLVALGGCVASNVALSRVGVSVSNAGCLVTAVLIQR